MLLIDNRSEKNVAVNLALEELLMGFPSGGEAILLLYVNAPAVVIGRNQIPHVEANLQQLQQQRVALARRLSGGGTVYHDSGNVNFSLIETRRKRPFASSGEAVRPVLACLRGLGLPVQMNKRYDLLLKGMKITGTAQYRAQGKCLTHGTLLVSANLKRMRALLAPDSDVPFSRGRSSVPSPVTNVIEFQPELTVDKVCRALIPAFATVHGRAKPLKLPAADWPEVRRLAASKYCAWEWSVGRSPEFKIRRKAVFAWGPCEALIRVRRGIVIGVDLLLPDGAPPELGLLRRGLEGRCYRPDDVAVGIRETGLPEHVSGAATLFSEWLCVPGAFWGCGEFSSFRQENRS